MKKIILIFVCVMVVPDAAPLYCAPGGETFKTFLDEGTISLNKADYSSALKNFQLGLALSDKTGDQKSRCSFLTKIGEVYSSSGDYKKAIYFFSEALQISENLKNRRNVLANLINLGVVNGLMGNQIKAVSYYEDAMKLSKGGAFRKEFGESLYRIASANAELGFYQKSTSFFRRAIEVFGELGLEKNVGKIYLQLADMHGRFGDFETANNYCYKALKIGKDTGDMKLIGKSFESAGKMHAGRGLFPRAAASFRQALDIAEKSGDNGSLSVNYSNVGLVLLDMADFQAAVSSCAKAVEIARGTGDRPLLSETLLRLAFAQRIELRFEEALTCYGEALRLNHETGMPVEQIERNMAGVLFDMGKINEAEEAYLKLSDYTELGRLNLAKKNYAKSIAYFNAALQESAKNRDIDSLYKIYSGLGHAYLELKDFPKSEENYVKAISFIEDVGAAPFPGKNASYFKAKPFFGEYSKLYEGMIRALVSIGSIDEAFTYSEKLRLISFSGNFVEARPKDSKKLPENILSEERKNAAKLNALRIEIDAVYGNHSRDAAGGIEVEFQSAKEKNSRFVEKLRSICPGYALIKYPKAARPPELNLKSDESLLEFEVTDEESYLFRIDGRTKKVRVKNINLPRQKIKELVLRYRSNLNAGKNRSNKNFDKKHLEKLYQILFGDFIDDLPAGSKLIIAPDECLNAISFEPLIAGNKVRGYLGRGLTAGSERFLADKYDVTYAQSAASLMIFRAQNMNADAPKNILAFSAGPGRGTNMAGEPSFSIPSQNMLDSLRVIYSTSAVTAQTGCVNKKKIFETPFHEYGVVIFDMPVTFSKEGSGRGEGIIFLTLDETAGLRMNCGIMALTGAVWPQKENLDGYSAVEIGAAFQYAGAKDILLNLWQTDENSSAIFYDVFFRNLKQGETPAEAAFSAKKEIIKKGCVDPYFWAGYVLIKG